MGLFDSIKDKLGLDKDENEQAAPQAAPTPEEQARIDGEQASNEATAAAAQAELDAKEKAEADARAKAEAEKKAAEDAKAKADAEAKAKADAEAAKQKADAEAKAKADAQAKAKSEAEAKANAAKADAAKTEAAKAAAAKRTYTVKPGDNLSTIAEKFGVNYMDIARANGVKNPDLIYPGQVFTIPE